MFYTYPIKIQSMVLGLLVKFLRWQGTTNLHILRYLFKSTIVFQISYGILSVSLRGSLYRIYFVVSSGE